MHADDSGKAPQLTTSELTYRLYGKYGTTEEATTDKYIVATQVRSQAGTFADTTADAVIIGNWPSSDYEVHGFEIKVSRADWLNELKKPDKATAVKQYCHRWYLLIASASMVKDGELPDDWGLIVPYGNGLRIIKKAPLLQPKPLEVSFVAALLRANKRECMPMDIHQQYLQDNYRKVKKELDDENKQLREFVTGIKELLGIEIERKKQQSYENGRYVTKYKWTAKVRGRWQEYNPEQLIKMLEIVASADLEQAQKSMARLRSDAHDILKKTEHYKDFSTY